MNEYVNTVQFFELTSIIVIFMNILFLKKLTKIVSKVLKLC